MRFEIEMTNSSERPHADAVKGTDGRWYIEIPALEDILELSAWSECEIIVSAGGLTGSSRGPSLEIYNDYRE